MRKESIFWSRMFIGTEEKESKSDGNVICYEPPPFFTNRFLSKFNVDYTFTPSDQLLEKAEIFYSKEFKLKNGNKPLINTGILKRWINIGSLIVTLNKSNKIKGSAISLVLPIKIKIKQDKLIEQTYQYTDIIDQNDDVIVMGLTTHLNLHHKLRNKGLGMVLIQRSLQCAYDIGITCAYFINTESRCSNSVPLISWSYPLDVHKLISYGLGYNGRYTQKYKINIPADISYLRVDKTNYQECYNTYRNLIENLYNVFCPNLYFWKRWILNIPTYIVKRKDKNIGVFSYNGNNIEIAKINKIIPTAYPMFCIGEQPSTILSLLDVCKKDKYEVVNITQTGTLTRQVLQSINADKLKGLSYINFYNTDIHLTAEDIHFPLV